MYYTIFYYIILYYIVFHLHFCSGFPQCNRHLAFTLEVKSKSECFFVTLMAARPTDKAIWTSDISQVRCVHLFFDFENPCYQFQCIFINDSEVHRSGNERQCRKEIQIKIFKFVT